MTECQNHKSIFTSVIDLLNTDGFIVCKIQGESMYPMLAPNRDLVTIKAIGNHKLLENDVVLYYKSNKLILHRIIHISSSGNLTILGDNCSKKEYDVAPDDIIGVLTKFTHNGVNYNIENHIYQKYIYNLRKTENIRIIKKRIIDTIIWYCRFFPPKRQNMLKHFLRFLLRYNISYE